jgi:tripartite ATP-independent transporter DctP family solute receptor
MELSIGLSELKRNSCQTNPLGWSGFFLSIFFLSLSLPFLLAGCNRNDNGAFVFRYGHSQPPQAQRSKSMTFFKQQLETRSAGKIMVENYFSGTLGSEREMMDMVATGVLQGTRGGLFADANPKFVLFMLPFLVADWDEASRLVNSELAKSINEAARDNGFHIPATGISQGFRAHTNNVHPIHSPKDLEGLKMRVPPQEIYVLTAQAFGSSPQEMPASDIYSALKTGVLDGQDNPPSNIWDYHIYEVQDFMTVSHYSTGPDPLMVDLAWYETLPGELQSLFDEVARETLIYSDRLNREAEEVYIQKLSAVLKVNHLDADQLEAFRELSKQVYEHYVHEGVLTAGEIQQARLIAAGKQ